MEKCNITVDLIPQDECKGCYTQPLCINLNESIPYFNLESSDTLKDLIEALVVKIGTLEYRIEQLENGL